MKRIALVTMVGALLATASASAGAGLATITCRSFGAAHGKQLSLYTLTNSRDMRVQIINFGAAVTSISVPDRKGHFSDVMLGYARAADYVKNNNAPEFGALIGRYANRIDKGRFTLDGKTYQLTINDPPNTLHGGAVGFSDRVWTAKPVKHRGIVALALHYVSKDGEEHYPGDLDTTVTYTLANDNALRVDYTATTDQNTVVNLTFHPYFNLDGQASGSVLDEILTINAGRYTPIDANAIPTGPLAPVRGTPFDFRKPTPIGAHIGDPSKQLIQCGGYDHNFVLNRKGPGIVFAARLYAPRSGRLLRVYTTQPGLQFFTANAFNGSVRGKGGLIYKNHGGLSLEAQHFPDSPNHPNFPTTELKRDQIYRQTTIYRFSVEGRKRASRDARM